jgi:hypothetical protein
LEKIKKERIIKVKKQVVLMYSLRKMMRKFIILKHLKVNTIFNKQISRFCITNTGRKNYKRKK